MKSGFAAFHPLVQTMFFIVCISINMFIMHPVILSISLISSFIYICYSWGISGLIFCIRVNFITSAMIIIINPLISHNGITVIGHLPSGNVITAESVIFGCAAAALMSASVNWFYCVNKIITSEKIIYLFGRIMPKGALLISMVLSFSGKLSSHFREVKAAHMSVSVCSNKDIHSRLKISMQIISSMIQWSLENFVDTADTMSSKGYGTSKRTNYSVYRLRIGDIIFILLLLSAAAIIFICHNSEVIYFSYYPVSEIVFENKLSFIVFAIYAVICNIPLLTTITEGRKWNYSMSES